MDIELKWRKSSRSGANGGDCVELAVLDDGVVGVRDSKNPAGPVQRFGVVELAAFLADVRGGRYNR